MLDLDLRLEYLPMMWRFHWPRAAALGRIGLVLEEVRELHYGTPERNYGTRYSF